MHIWYFDLFFLSKIFPSQTTAGGHQKYNWNQNLNDIIAHEIKYDLKIFKNIFFILRQQLEDINGYYGHQNLGTDLSSYVAVVGAPTR